jgi:hypothetical protein
MTDAERDARALMSRIKALEEQWASEAARKERAQVAREAIARREQAYARARTAAVEWALANWRTWILKGVGAGREFTPERAEALLQDEERRRQVLEPVLAEPIERLRHHVADLALEDPPIDLRWLARGGPTERLLKTSQAVAVLDRRAPTVYAPPVIDDKSYAVCLHEIGHLRSPVGHKLMSEVEAWKWAVSAAMVWSRDCHREMARCLMTYVDTADRTAANLEATQEIERLCSSLTLARERQTRLDRQLAADAEQLASQLKGRQCGACARAQATAVERGHLYCARCLQDKHAAEQAAAVDAEIARQRAWRRQHGSSLIGAGRKSGG